MVKEARFSDLQQQIVRGDKPSLLAKELELSYEDTLKLGSLLAAFTESPRCAVFLLVPEAPNYIQQRDLVQKFYGNYQNTEFADGITSRPIGYCNQVLSDVGVIRKLFILSSGSKPIIGFQRTELGQKSGVEAAALSLHFERESGVSLLATFGSWKGFSFEVQTQLTRARILIYLSRHDLSVRQADICKDLEMHQGTVRDSLKALARAGVIDYTSVTGGAGSDQVSYVIGNLQPPEERLPHASRRLLQEVISVCLYLAGNGKPITIGGIVEMLPEGLAHKYSYESLDGSVRSIVSALNSAGFLRRGKFKGFEKLSDVNINDVGKMVVSQFLEPYLEISRGNTVVIDQLKSSVTDRVTSRLAEYTSETLPYDYPHTQVYKIMSASKNREAVAHLISTKPRCTQEISGLVGLDVVRIREILGNLVRKNKAQVFIIKGIKYYLSKESSRSDLAS